MAKIFIDANIFINICEKRNNLKITDFNEHELCISPLSVHILMYIAKKRAPYDLLTEVIKSFTIISFDKSICNKSMTSPTTDFEDNVQLHSAAQAECDFFITEDKKLLSMKFFGKTQITTRL